ncbi:MAG: diguanylate cyclase [Candidatus Omnitrophica bacterium]|nr:diguanylate cyclase [Candidatus Omnitrophota bacterium]
MAKKLILGAGIPQFIFKNLSEQFSPEIFEFVNFSSAQELIKNIKKYKINLIFVYNMLPDLKDCQELCIALRAQADTETVPIIVISHMDNNPEEKIKMLRGGLIDIYASSLVSTEELAAYANVFLQRQALEEELEIKNEMLSKLSIVDDLTKLYNRRYLTQRLEEELKRIKRYDYPLSCLMLDIDHFKNINDSFGHSSGDMALEKFSDLIKKTLRTIDICCRYGGEEIVVILPFTNFEGAFHAGERLRKKIEEFNFGTEEKPLKFTVSVGLICADGKDNATVDSLFKALDKKLYEAKNSGRNKTCGGLYKNIKINPD